MSIDYAEMKERGQVRASNGTLRSSRGKTLLQIKGSLSDALIKYSEYVLNKAIRPAVFAGAEHMYLEMRAKTPVDPFAKDPGLLLESIYKYFDVAKGTQVKPIYYIGPNMTKAKHWWLVENGHYGRYAVRFDETRQRWYTVNGKKSKTPKLLDKPIFVPPTPYIRPTYDANAKQVITIMREKLREELYKAPR